MSIKERGSLRYLAHFSSSIEKLQSMKTDGPMLGLYAALS